MFQMVVAWPRAVVELPERGGQTFLEKTGFCDLVFRTRRTSLPLYET